MERVPMKRMVFHAFFIALIAASSILWYLSLAYAVDYLSKGRLWLPGFRLLGLMEAHPWLRPFHYLASVDFSTVTTLLLVLIVVPVYVNFSRLYRGRLGTVTRYPASKFYQIVSVSASGNGKSRRLLPAMFPLFHGYKVTFLQMGLMGTLLAMTVAFQETSDLTAKRASPDRPATDAVAPPNGPEDAGTPAGFDAGLMDEESRRAFAEGRALKKKMDDLSGNSIERIDAKSNDAQMLLAALGTALWSSLAAIFIAFIVGPYALEPLARGYATRRHGHRLAPLSLPDPSEVGKGLDELHSHARGTGRSLADLGRVLGQGTAEAEVGGSLIEGFQKLNKELERMNQAVNNASQFETLSEIRQKLERLRESEIPRLKSDLLEKSDGHARELHLLHQGIAGVQAEMKAHREILVGLSETVRKAMERNDDKIIRRAVTKMRDYLESQESG